MPTDRNRSTAPARQRPGHRRAVQVAVRVPEQRRSHDHTGGVGAVLVVVVEQEQRTATAADR